MPGCLHCDPHLPPSGPEVPSSYCLLLLLKVMVFNQYFTPVSLFLKVYWFKECLKGLRCTESYKKPLPVLCDLYPYAKNSKPQSEKNTVYVKSSISACKNA